MHVAAIGEILGEHVSRLPVDVHLRQTVSEHTEPVRNLRLPNQPPASQSPNASGVVVGTYARR